jgi:hypothetical protein
LHVAKEGRFYKRRFYEGRFYVRGGFILRESLSSRGVFTLEEDHIGRKKITARERELPHRERELELCS